MVDKTFLFKVDTNVKEETRYEKSYRVKKMTDDVDVIAKFKAKYSVGEVFIIMFKLILITLVLK
jgi:hypothetical protein